MNAMIDAKSKSLSTVKRYTALFEAAAKKVEAKAGDAVTRRVARKLDTIAANLKRGKVVRAATLYRRSDSAVHSAVSL